MKLLVACIMLLSEFLALKAQLLLGQYPITLDNINVMDMNLSVRVNVDFHIGISPDKYENLTRSNCNISIIATASDTIETIETPLDGIVMFSSSDNIQFLITSFKENVNYSILFQSNDIGQSTVTNISDSFSLLTTSVQRVTVGFVTENRATVLCHFLPGTKSDGCLVQWQKLGTEGDKSEVLARRNATESMVTVLLSSLQPNTTYAVEAFSMMGSDKLHSFGLPLEHNNLVTQSPSSASEQTETTTMTLAIGIGFGLLSLGLICAIVTIIIILWSVHKKKKNQRCKRNFVMMPIMSETNNSTTLHSYITARGSRGTNADDIALQLNVCYTCSPNVTDSDHGSHEELETMSLHLYDDIIMNQSTSQRHHQPRTILPLSVAPPVNRKDQHLSHFEVANESCDHRDSSPLQSPDYVISSITSVVLSNVKESFKFSSDSLLATPTYENVDPDSGSPVAPHGGEPIVRSEWTTRDTEQPERATLPLAGIHVTEKGVYNPHKAAPVVEPAEYEEPVASLTRGQKLQKKSK